MSDPTSVGGTADELTFSLDGRSVVAHKGEKLIAAAERAGVFIPRFCYHPRMKPVGVCRMCLVEVDGPSGPSLMPSCFIDVQPDMVVVTESDTVKKAQDGVLEFLLINHPLDCPVCDKGGECPLQDQTLAYGPGESRFIEEKRHFEKPIPISDLVLLDRERCIQCSRCTRFADEVAGEAQIDFVGRGPHIEVAPFPELPFTSYFSGNTVQICPVGALTATPYRFTARPWDLDQVESTCTTCSLGCRVAVQSSSNRLTRLLGIDADPVNQGWMCDKGRFAFEAVNDPGRLTRPLVRKNGGLVEVSWYEALEAAAAGLKKARTDHGPAGVGVIGGARLTNEAAYAWTKLAKGVIGTDSVDAQLGDGLPAELVVGLPRATIDEAVNADTVILLTGDVREEVPVLFLRLRAGVRYGSLNVVELSPGDTSMTGLAAASLRYAPGEADELVRILLDVKAPTPNGMHPDEFADARRLIGSPRVVVVLGRGSRSEDETIMAAAAQRIAAALPGATFLPVLPRGNVMGALDLGMAPGLLPGRVALDDGAEWFGRWWDQVPAGRGRTTMEQLADLASPEPSMGAVVLLGADPWADVPDRRLVERAFDSPVFVVAVGTQIDSTTERADVVLPAASVHERSGTTTNMEGRISRLGQKLVPPGQAWADWMIAAELAVHLGSDLALESVGAIWDEIERLTPLHSGITSAVLGQPGAADGVVAPLSAAKVSLFRRRGRQMDPVAIPGVESTNRQGLDFRAGWAEDPTSGWTGRPAVPVNPTEERPSMLRKIPAYVAPVIGRVDSYSHRLMATRCLYDNGAAMAKSPALDALVEPATLAVHPHDLDDLGLSAGDRVRVKTASTSMVMAVRPDPGLPTRVVALPMNVMLDGVPDGSRHDVADLIDVTVPVTVVRLETP